MIGLDCRCWGIGVLGGMGVPGGTDDGGVGGIYVALLIAGGELMMGWPNGFDEGSNWPG